MFEKTLLHCLLLSNIVIEKCKAILLPDLVSLTSCKNLLLFPIIDMQNIKYCMCFPAFPSLSYSWIRVT